MHLASNCETTSAPNSLSNQVVSAAFALHAAMTKCTDSVIDGLCPMHPASLPSLRSPAHADAPGMSANRDHPATVFASRKSARIHMQFFRELCLVVFVEVVRYVKNTFKRDMQ
jgi:hypothetical protein